MDHHRHSESESESNAGDVSSAQAVLLGALAPGVNVSLSLPFLFPFSQDFAIHLFIYLFITFQQPTWITLQSAFLMLGLCLAFMLGLAFSASDSSLVLHVGFLVLICLTLFFLLSWYFLSYLEKPSYKFIPVVNVICCLIEIGISFFIRVSYAEASL